MNNSTNIFGERLKYLRTEKGLTQSELGKELGISRGAISYYEAGDRMPDINVLYDVAKYFNVSSDYLIGLSDNSTTDITIKEISNRIGLSDKAIENMEKLNKSTMRDNKHSYLRGIDYIFSKTVEVSIQEGRDFPEIDYSKNYQGSLIGGFKDELLSFVFYGDGIAFLQCLNRILFSSYIDFNPYSIIGYDSDNEYIVAKTENVYKPYGTFTILDTENHSNDFDLEIITKAQILKLNDIITGMRDSIEHHIPDEIKIVYDKERNQFLKTTKKQELESLGNPECYKRNIKFYECENGFENRQLKEMED